MYCTECHRECEPAGDAVMGFEEVSKCHRAKVLDGDDQWIVMAIRRMWAGDGAILAGRKGHLDNVDRASFNPDYPFGNAGYSSHDANADLELLKMFRDERENHDDDLHTIWVLIRG